jgi:phage-related protein
VDYLNRVRQQGTRLPANIVKHLEGELWEARPEDGGVEYRFLLFIADDKRIGGVSAFMKKRQKIERKVIERALHCVEEMRQRWQENQDE